MASGEQSLTRRPFDFSQMSLFIDAMQRDRPSLLGDSNAKTSKTQDRLKKPNSSLCIIFKIRVKQPLNGSYRCHFVVFITVMQTHL